MPAATSPKKSIGKVLKKVSADIILTAITVISLCVLGYVVYAYIRSAEIGTEIGTTAGKAAGRLSGSFDGITEGLAEGAKEGKDAGMSAEDTEVSIGNRIQAVGKLEVLSATVVMHDLLEIGGKQKGLFSFLTGDDAKYKTLIAFYGDVTFTVDLYDASIDPQGTIYNVVLPMPEATVRINDSKTQQLDSYMKHSWTGSNEDGYTAAINSIKQITLNAEESVTNYDLLKESAKDSAIKQVTFLIQSATKEEVVVHVSFKDELSEEDNAQSSDKEE